MISVVVVGNGNVAHHLIQAFIKNENIELLQVYARTIKSIQYLQNYTSITDDLSLIMEADVCIVAVSDDAISEVSSQLKTKNLIAHTSGSVTISSLKNKSRKGVFYPLQSFSKEKDVNFKEVPFCLEAEDKNDLKLLENLAASIGEKIYHINSHQRSKLHVAAVFVNNFTNHMYTIGNDICNEYNVPFEVLNPLIKETADKIEHMVPKEAQTGPAKRNDIETIERHLSLLNKEQQEIYKTITKSIQNG